jgi:hypothetical protein
MQSIDATLSLSRVADKSSYVRSTPHLNGREADINRECLTISMKTSEFETRSHLAGVR